MRLEVSAGYPASVTTQQGLILAGGGDYRAGETQPWHYYSAVSLLTNNRWTSLGDLPQPLADLRLVTTQFGGTTRLWAIGGSNVPQRSTLPVGLILLSHVQVPDDSPRSRD